jgi:hypothetical protein
MSLNKATLLFLVFLLLISFSLSLVPGHNGDMPFYIAAVFSSQGATDENALSAAKEVLHTEMAGEEAASHVNRLEHADKNILDFYRIKPLYVYSVAGLHKLGISFILSTLIPSLFSFFLIGWIVFSWSTRFFDPLPALVFSALLLLINPSIILARLSSPDPLSNLFLFFCFYRIYFERKYLWTILLLLISLFIRMDNIVSVVILLTSMKYWPGKNSATRIPGMVYLVSLFLAGMICFCINFHFEKNFWWFTHITYIQSFHAYGVQVLIYFLSVSESFIPALLLLSLLALFQRKLNIRKKSGLLLLSVGLIFFGRFLLFPSYEERFATSFYLAGFLILLELLLGERSLKPVSSYGLAGGSGN